MDPATSFASLGDPTRIRILRLIRDSADGRALVGRLAEALELRQPTVSHHVKVLHDDGIVVREPEGRRVWYWIADEHADRVDALLGGGLEPARQPDLERIARDLSLRFRGVFSPETVHATVLESCRLLVGSSRSPVLASRTATFAATRLEALSHEIAHAPAVPTVLFVCVQNAGRSQIAAGILRQLAGDRVAVRTAGSEPASDVRHSIAAALEEIGVSLGGEFPKPLTDEVVRAADVVVTMGCGDACPVYAGRRYLDWDLDDPVGKSPERIRAIRDDIEVRVRGLLVELFPERSSDPAR
ncbi:metalloregulator ArsR/SmtB family transcription factor [Microbacterium sp. SS28]|uniref:metalloregulator ArsR/SmtB family transcription factor n=1 Tax=Microbacterium sp. SS28 TaxID=2919948 RepID=UPI001FAA8800|nr:metalloregulator ArsR/SmtB family transcription factor [Microbacterium sp. SS28]